jgi:Flp pilus assembly pilin Flp
VGAMRQLFKRNRQGQSLIEYAMVAAIVSAAIIAMSTYVYRSVQATQKVIQEEFSDY